MPILSNQQRVDRPVPVSVHSRPPSMKQDILLICKALNFVLIKKFTCETLPATQAVMKQATAPDTKDRRIISATTGRFSGHSEPIKPSCIPIEPKLEKPHRALLDIGRHILVSYEFVDHRFRSHQLSHDHCFINPSIPVRSVAGAHNKSQRKEKIAEQLLKNATWING
uniref:Uncharacterized protein n=1 Tax=Romanomermis culicivorax TaxID=13658 RepID=A0A915L4K7_ROMCU